MFEEADREINFESSRSLIRLFEMRVRKIRKKKKKIRMDSNNSSLLSME